MPTNPQIKGLPPATPAVLFRIVERALKTDPILSNVVRTWRSWEGDPKDVEPPAKGNAPWVRMTPRISAENWWAQSTQKGTLFIDFDLWLDGTCIDDLLNLWWAMQRAIYSPDAATRNALQTRLNSKGAWPGTIAFGPAQLGPGSDDSHMESSASMYLDFRFDVNPTSPGL